VVPGWFPTSDLPRVRRFSAQRISVSAGQVPADGPDWTRWSTCSESLAIVLPLPSSWLIQRAIVVSVTAEIFANLEWRLGVAAPAVDQITGGG
jgi:hypothetical protein